MELSGKFREDFAQFVRHFDAQEDAFEGPQLERLARELLAAHDGEIGALAASVYAGAYPNCSAREALDEDLRLLASREQVGAEPAGHLLAELYWRACRGCYLRVTLSKSRLGREEERGEPVHLARLALRYQPTSFRACYWYMIALGWQLEATRSPRERALTARCFMESARRCLELEPRDRLAQHLLGRYYFEVAQLSWLERRLAAKLAGGGELRGSLADAERALLEAHQAGDWLPTGLWMARVKLAQGAPAEEARRWVRFGLRQKAREPSSELERDQLRQLAAQLKLCD